MAITLKLTPVYETYVIEIPGDGDFEVRVRAATTGDDEQRSELFRKQRRVYNDAAVGETAVEQEWNFHQINRVEVALTLAGCDLKKEVEKLDPKTREVIEVVEVPVFDFKERRNGLIGIKDESEFYTAWKELPDKYTSAIHDKILAKNPQWKPVVAGSDTSGE